MTFKVLCLAFLSCILIQAAPSSLPAGPWLCAGEDDVFSNAFEIGGATGGNFHGLPERVEIPPFPICSLASAFIRSHNLINVLQRKFKDSEQQSSVSYPIKPASKTSDETREKIDRKEYDRILNEYNLFDLIRAFMNDPYTLSDPRNRKLITYALKRARENLDKSHQSISSRSSE